MPKRAPVPCREPGCPVLSHDKADRGYCTEHQWRLQEAKLRRKQTNRRAAQRANQKRRADEEQSKLDSFYNSALWKKVRMAHRTREPLCRHCHIAGRVTAGNVVDHIIERRDGGADYDPANLQTLCHACHSIKTKTEQMRRTS